ncbi:hypothetical protein PWT90_04957 [Aphanocladium album]|nr:hypothetical protein PWT90_04957 [Aphanocladium album]
MKCASSAFSVIAPQLFSHIAVAALHHHYFYCGHGHEAANDSTRAELIKVVKDDPYPNFLAVQDPARALFQSFDNEEGVFYVEFCNKGCIYKGTGHDDICASP